MRKAFILALIASFAMLLCSCASSEPEPVQVIGEPQDLVALEGEWTGTYESGTSGRSGSIVFHLTENPLGAHGDVLMLPKQEVTYDHTQPHLPRSMASSASVLSIEFIRVAAGEVSGKIAPYIDPEQPEAILETHFHGHVDGDWIEGTFVTYSDRGVSPRHGKWRAHRK